MDKKEFLNTNSYNLKEVAWRNYVDLIQLRKEYHTLHIRNKDLQDALANLHIQSYEYQKAVDRHLNHKLAEMSSRMRRVATKTKKVLQSKHLDRSPIL